MNWVDTTINLGTIPTGKTVKFEYIATKDLKIKSIKPNCGSCTTVGKYKDGILPVSFKPGSVPKHLKERQDFYLTTNFIKVVYKDRQGETLTFKAVVKDGTKSFKI